MRILLCTVLIILIRGQMGIGFGRERIRMVYYEENMIGRKLINAFEFKMPVPKWTTSFNVRIKGNNLVIWRKSK